MFNLIDMNWQHQLQMLGSVAIAAVLGGAVGFEREVANRPAGIRTHAILAAASCLLVVLGDTVVRHFATESAPELLRADPVRVIEAIVTGTAFLGAGTIFRRGTDTVEGLTTGASLLLVAALGIAVGLRQVLLAATIAVLALLILRAAGTLFTPVKKDERR